ncbi:MAG TPA: hypothetical protein VG870_05420 [Chitinophagaceae bacterium]|nr:hypothetical protein [Chitinophagaceae bacterium]
MTTERIEDFLTTRQRAEKPVRIFIRGRNPVEGLFVRARDYDELKAKNFWRVVQLSHLKDWQKTQDLGLTRVFSGLSFTRLSDK